MNHLFGISETDLQSLRTTRQGRVSLAGFNYQASFAIARIAAMITNHQILDLDGLPTAIRYDWAEDLDERCDDLSVCFNQCKKISDIGQPASVANVLIGFAPKLLLTPSAEQSKIRLRLICTDRRFGTPVPLAKCISKSKVAVRKRFVAEVKTNPTVGEDRVLWQQAAVKFGLEELFEALWSKTEGVFLSDTVHENLPSGTVLTGERDALRHLLEFRIIDSSRQRDTVVRLRSLVHENLIRFDPVNSESVDIGSRAPHVIRRADATTELFEYRRQDSDQLPFEIITRLYLRHQLARPKRHFVGRPPEWADVVHGFDSEIKFVERDQTDALRTAVLRDVIDPIQRGDSRLPVKFVLGAPGSGKTTLVRRVVATLVEQSEVVAVDPGVYLNNPVDSDSFRARLHELASLGKPLLLVLDDPLYGDSEWPQLLGDLAAPRAQIGVLAASPTLLYEQHSHLMRGRIETTEFRMDSPSDAERKSLGRLYNQSSSVHAGADDFLVLCMEHAAGVKFDTIIERLWETLNDGNPISPSVEYDDYPWPVRAFLLTCFFHRAYIPCPEAIIRCVTRSGSRLPHRRSVTDVLQQMTFQNGWNVFRVQEYSGPPSLAFKGNQVSTTHQRIAERAWDLRPAPWRNLNHIMVEASLETPSAVREVAELAVALRRIGDDSFAKALVYAWRNASVETRQLNELQTCLILGQCCEEAKQFDETFSQRIRNGNDGWVAVLSLWASSSKQQDDRTLLSDSIVEPAIASADFSIAPARAGNLYNLLPKHMKRTFRHRLYQILDGEVSLAVPLKLLLQVLATASNDELAERLPKTCRMVFQIPSGHVIEKLLVLMIKLQSSKFQSVRKEVAEATAEWLAMHPDSHVRVLYLKFLARFSEELTINSRQAIVETRRWLSTTSHGSANSKHYFSLIANLEEQDLLRNGPALLAKNEDDFRIREQYLGALEKARSVEFDSQRRDAVRSIREWLANNPEHTQLRNAFLRFLWTLPASSFAEQIRQGARDTREWLDKHSAHSNVRNQYLTFMSKVPLGEPFVQEHIDSATDVSRWLSLHDDAYGTRHVYLNYVRRLDGADYRVIKRHALSEAIKWMDSPDCEHNFFETCLTFMASVGPDDSKSWEISLERLRRTVSQDPVSQIARNCLGRLLFHAGRYAEACHEFEECLLLNQDQRDVQLLMAECHLKRGKYSDAKVVLQSTLDFAHRNQRHTAAIHTKSGWLFIQAQLWTDAIRAFKAARHEHPNYFANYWGIGRAEFELGNFENAAIALQMALEKKPELLPPARDEINAMLSQCYQ